jgi:hypothetical protein
LSNKSQNNVLCYCANGQHKVVFSVLKGISACSPPPKQLPKMNNKITCQLMFMDVTSKSSKYKVRKQLAKKSETENISSSSVVQLMLTTENIH